MNRLLKLLDSQGPLKSAPHRGLINDRHDLVADGQVSPIQSTRLRPMAEQSLKAAPRSLDQALYLIGSSVAGGDNPLEITFQHPDPTGALAGGTDQIFSAEHRADEQRAPDS